MSQERIPRKFQGVWIPASLWLDHSLSTNEKVMLVEISSLEDDVRGCYATNAHFAAFFGLSVSRVSEIISGLAERGLIKVEQIREGKRVIERRLRLSNPFDKPKTPSENAANPFGKGDEPPSENTQGSNTPMSNTKRVKALRAQDPEAEAAFDQFWKLYPKKKSRKDALKAWEKLDPDAELQSVLLASLAKHCVSRDWTKEGGQFIPNAATWLNGERWHDVLQPACAASKGSNFNNLPQHTPDMYQEAPDGRPNF
ncbi:MULTISPECIES: helix-turn-helix domain-containing protein [Pseudomonas]|uniref:helix-turn-helix domain-containing protein n=1 Tax=Pseudomonas TaxID=286 RepID=UPI0015F4AEC4|nr:MULTISPECIES: helix-turn-helix domain-containing protein [Pseudomonas]MBA6120779.1 helix-turn-helix domain-containing protein [Pseudomonas juntendi]WBM34282.1 helix-turn-helix domain-containing protein [Pseudomonas sp. NY11382]